MIALQVAGPGGYLGVHHGALRQTAIEFTQTSSTMRPRPSKNVMQNGGWVGIDVRNGTTLWTTATPGAIGNFPTRAVSVANGVFFTTSYGSFNDSIYPLDVKTGRVL
ncbi:unnamed protein product [Sphagnum troendelagicum]